VKKQTKDKSAIEQKQNQKKPEENKEQKYQRKDKAERTMVLDAKRLESRDFEILRTLVRVHFLRYAQVSAAFFSTDQAARRRIQKLQGRGLIERHSKGAPPGMNYCAWRITNAGLAALTHDMPQEPIPEYLVDRLERQSLNEHYHREGVAGLYLSLVVTDRPESADRGVLRRWAAEIRRRAELVTWRADGDTILHLPGPDGDRRIVPDACAEPRGKRERYFIEYDRSTKPLSSIAATLKLYASYIRTSYGRAFGDDRAPWVVYVLRTDARRRNIAKQAQSILGPAGIRWKVLTESTDAVAWLSDAIFGEPEIAAEQPPRPAIEPAQLRLLVEAHLRASEALLREGSAVVEELEQSNPETVAPWKRSLGSLYALMRPSMEGPHGR